MLEQPLIKFGIRVGIRPDVVIVIGQNRKPDIAAGLFQGIDGFLGGC